MSKTIITIVLLGVVASLGGCGPISFTLGSSPADRKIEAAVVQEAHGWTSDRVAVIDVTGLIYNANRVGLLSETANPVSALHEKLEDARKDHRVKAVILRLNSPGGTVTASDAMYREVMRFRKLSGKPVVALEMDVAASGAYYLACSANRIVAYPTSVTGSIGVIMQTVSIKPLLDRWGVKTDAIVSGPNKDAGSLLSDLTPKQRALFQHLVDEFYANFKSIVKHARPNIPDDQFATVTDGRVFTGVDAAKLGLVDRTGDLYDAMDEAMKLAGIKDAKLVLYHREGEYAGSAYADTSTPPGRAAAPSGGGSVTNQINLAQINLGADMGLPQGTGMFLYLWEPGGGGLGQP